LDTTAPVLFSPLTALRVPELNTGAHYGSPFALFRTVPLQGTSPSLFSDAFTTLQWRPPFTTLFRVASLALTITHLSRSHEAHPLQDSSS